MIIQKLLFPLHPHSSLKVIRHFYDALAITHYVTCAECSLSFLFLNHFLFPIAFLQVTAGMMGGRETRGEAAAGKFFSVLMFSLRNLISSFLLVLRATTNHTEI